MNSSGFTPPGAYYPPPVPDLEPQVHLARPGPPLSARHTPVEPSEPYEADRISVLCTQIPLSDVSAVLLKTSRRWKGIDVFIQTDYETGTGFGFLTVQLFGVTRGVRVLLASGRTRGNVSPAVGAAGPVRVCSSRVLADSYEIVLSRDTAPNAALQFAEVSYVATDEALPSPASSDGVIAPRQAGGRALEFFPVLGANSLRPELVGFTCVNQSGAEFWYTVYFGVSPPITGMGTTPAFSLHVPDKESLLVADNPLFLQSVRHGGVFTAASLSPIAYVELADPTGCYHNMWFR